MLHLPPRLPRQVRFLSWPQVVRPSLPTPEPDTGTLTGVTIVSGTTTWTLATGNAVTQASSVAAGDNGMALSALAGTLDVASSTSFTTKGQVSVVASGGTAVLAYTGTGTGTLTGVTIVSGTTTWTLATGNAVTQPTAAGSRRWRLR